MSKVKRQPAGSPDTLAGCGRSVDRMPHETGPPELHTVCSCRDRLCQIWEAARHGSRLAPSDEERQQWAPAICRDRTRTHKVDHSTSDLRWYFGSSPQPSWWARGGLLGQLGQALRAYLPPLGEYHVTEQCLTSGCARPGRGPFPGSHPHTSITTIHIHIHPSIAHRRPPPPPPPTDPNLLSTPQLWLVSYYQDYMCMTNKQTCAVY